MEKLNTNVPLSVAKASLFLTFIGLFSKGIGFIRELVYAHNFGLSSKFDLYLVSVALITVLNTASIYICQHYFIPAYNRIKNEDRLNQQNNSDNFFNYTFWWFVLGGLILAGVLFILSEYFIDFYLTSASTGFKETGHKIFLIFLITIPINAGMSVITAYMQSNFKFIYPAVSQVSLNLIVIVLIIFFTDLFEIFVLPYSFVAAYFVAFIILSRPVFKKIKFISANFFKMKYKLSDINILIMLIFIEGFSLSYILVDRYFSGNVSEGGIAALNYALVIFSLPVTVFSTPLITTMFSKFSHSSSSGSNLTKDFITATGINYFIIIPMAFILFFWGDIVLKLFYERGEFTSSDTIITFETLQHYSISLAFYSSYLVSVKLLYSINKYNLIMIISIAAFILKIFFNIILVENLEQNGLALSTSFIYIFLFLLGFYLAIKKTKIEEKKFHFISLFYFLFNAAIAYFVTYLIHSVMRVDGVFFNAVNVLIFIIIYVLNSVFLNDTEFKIIKNTVLNIFRKRIGNKV